jgi:hypothetical protein
MCAASLDKKEDWMDAIVKTKGMASIMTTDMKTLEGEITLDETDWTNVPQ